MARYGEKFTYADGPLPSASYAVVAADTLHNVASGVCQTPAAGGNENYVKSTAFAFGTNDQFIRARVASFTGAGAGDMGLMLRMDTTGVRTFYCFLIQKNPTRTAIQKRVAGVFTELVFDTSTTWQAGDMWEGRVVGTTLTMFKNSVQVLTITDNAIASGGAGLRLTEAGATRTDTAMDDLYAGDFPDPTYLIQRHYN